MRGAFTRIAPAPARRRRRRLDLQAERRRDGSTASRGTLRDPAHVRPRDRCGAAFERDARAPSFSSRLIAIARVGPAVVEHEPRPGAASTLAVERRRARRASSAPALSPQRLLHDDVVDAEQHAERPGA